MFTKAFARIRSWHMMRCPIHAATCNGVMTWDRKENKDLLSHLNKITTSLEKVKLWQTRSEKNWTSVKERCLHASGIYSPSTSYWSFCTLSYQRASNFAINVLMITKEGGFSDRWSNICSCRSKTCNSTHSVEICQSLWEWWTYGCQLFLLSLC